MTTEPMKVTPEQIAKFRVELADHPDALAALDVIEEWDGDLADATESLATRQGIEGVEDRAELRWFDGLLQKCRDYICQPRYKALREKYVPALIPPLTDCLAVVLGCPPGIAGMLATPVAIYIKEQGMEQFCQIPIKH